jgi:RNA polymerase sigma factor (sigma-70 family)
MTKEWEDNFDALMSWLDPDRELAGQKYEAIRHSIIQIFKWRGCFDAEDLADEAITRVTNKVPEITPGYKGDPALYFYAVAKRLAFETTRRYQSRAEIENPDRLQDRPADDPEESREAEYECLDECLKKLPPAERQLILLYYQQDKSQIDHRKQLGLRYGLSATALRVKVHRIRLTLHGCIDKCLAVQTKTEMDLPENHG